GDVDAGAIGAGQDAAERAGEAALVEIRRLGLTGRDDVRSGRGGFRRGGAHGRLVCGLDRLGFGGACGQRECGNAGKGNEAAIHRFSSFWFRVDHFLPPNRLPITPRRICRPIWLPTVRALCFAMVSTIPWRRLVPNTMSRIDWPNPPL